MAFTFLLNQSPSNGTVATWNWIIQLKVAGWTDIEDSDGTTYAAMGGQVTGSNSGTNGLDNVSAWVRLKAPTGTREMLFQHRDSGDSRFWRIAMSPVAGFITGSPDATHTPDATDQFYFTGGGSGASPSWGFYWMDNTSYYQHVIASNASPYTWYNITYQKGSDDPNTVSFMEYLGTTVAAGDTDPYIYFNSQRTATCTGYGILSAENAGCFGYLNNLGTPTIVNISAPLFLAGGQIVIPTFIGSNSYTSKDEEVPLFLARRGALASPTGYKGVSNNVFWKGSNRATGDTLSTLTRIVIGDLTFPWDGSTIPLV